MELIDVTITQLARRSRSLVVYHNRSSLRRGLAPGEDVVLRDVDGEFYAGVVEDVDFELDDTVYRIYVGVRLPEDVAIDRLGMLVSPQRGDSGPEFVDMDRLLALLGQVRREQAAAVERLRARAVGTESDPCES